MPDVRPIDLAPPLDDNENDEQGNADFAGHDHDGIQQAIGARGRIDPLCDRLIHLISSLSPDYGDTIGTQHFYAFYLLSHGIIKAALVIGLLRNKLWAYPASLVVLGIFIVYQLYRFSYTHGFGLIVLTVFDVFVMGLIWHEYRLVRRHRTPQ